MGSSRERGFSVTPEKLAFIEQKMHEMGIETREALAESAGLSIDVIKKLFARKKVDRATIEEIARKALKIEPTKIIETERWYRPSKGVQSQASTDTDWQQVCRAMLDLQIQSPTLNDLMAKDGVRIDPDILFVPVGLVERKQKQYRRSDLNSAEQGSQLLQPTEEEIVQRFDNSEDFLSQVICNPNISNASRLVITGEPGSGKTTLLQKIGDRLLQNGIFPIWISLGKKGVPPTYKFLSHVLKENAQPQNVGSPNWETSINALFKAGRVWLLLDGADELTVSGSPLRIVGEQLRESWANQVKVVLTCRLNAWDTHALPEFKVFRTLEFDYQTPVDRYPNQVAAYIHQFFAKDGVAPQLADSLIQQLYIPARERIRDSVKNPLRLALLCYVWESGIGELPDTKAELYRLFVDYYYDLQELKHPETSIDHTERDTLNFALGEVAKAALDSDDSRFRLKKSLIESIPTMGKSDAKDSLFYKAIQLGWLTPIGTTTEKPHEAAYAFFHTTFQEYFAALAIDDWHYFLNHIPRDPTKGNYRIFDLQWEEVVLLWFGKGSLHQENIKYQKKEDFLQNLLAFHNDWEDFYQFKALLIAGSIITEFNKSSRCKKITEKLLQIAFGHFENRKQSWVTYSKGLAYKSRILLESINREVLNEALIEYVSNLKLYLGSSIVPEEYIIPDLLKLFRKNSSQEEKCISILEVLLEVSDEDLKLQVIDKLEEIESKNSSSTKNLENMLLSQDPLIRVEAASRLINRRIDHQPTRTLEHFLKEASSKDYTKGWMRKGRICQTAEVGLKATKSLLEIYPSHSHALKLLPIFQRQKDESKIGKPLIRIPEGLVNPVILDERLILESINILLDSSRDEIECAVAAEILTDFPVLDRDLDYFLRLVINLCACRLMEIKSNQPERWKYYWSVLFHCAKNMSYLAFYQAWNTSSSTNTKSFTNN